MAPFKDDWPTANRKLTREEPGNGPSGLYHEQRRGGCEFCSKVDWRDCANNSISLDEGPRSQDWSRVGALVVGKMLGPTGLRLLALNSSSGGAGPGLTNCWFLTEAVARERV